MTCIPLAVSYECFPKNSKNKISGALHKFLNGASGKLGDAFDMIDGLDTAVSDITEAMGGFTTAMGTLLQDKLVSFIDTGLMAAKNFIFNKITNPLAALAQNNAFVNAAFKPINGLFKAFGCLGSVVTKALKGTITNLLTNMIKKGFINPLECAVEDFIGTLTNKVSGLMDSIVQPLVAPLNSLFSIVGKGFGSIKGLLGKGLNILSKIQGLLSCGGGAKCMVQKEYCLKKGSRKEGGKADQQNFIARAFDAGTKKLDKFSDGLDKKIDNFEKTVRVDENGDKMDVVCNTGNIFECGFPRIEFFGGGGEGAIGDVILGNFIQELDAEISNTTFDVTSSEFADPKRVEELREQLKKIDDKIFPVRNQLNPLGSSIQQQKQKLQDVKAQVPGPGEDYIAMLEKNLKEDEDKLELLQSQLRELEAARREVAPAGLEYGQNLDEFVAQSIAASTVQTPIGGSLADDVKYTASILGVDLKYPGEGYTSEPLVSFVDNCDKGYGAYGRATIGKDPNKPTFGQVTGVIMISEGENYPAPDTPQDVFVERVEVEDGGSGYSLDDKIEDFEICEVDSNGSIKKVCVNDKPYRSLPSLNIEGRGSGAVLTPIMTYKRRKSEVITVIDCITPRGNIVGYVNGKEYNGPFHVHPETGQKMVGLAHTTTPHATIYNTPQESLRSGGTPSSNVGSTQIRTRTISELITESEASQTPTETYTDPVDEAGDTTPPPSSPPPSSPPSSGGGGYGGY